MGYTGTARAFVRSDVQEIAYSTEGLSLDFYRDAWVKGQLAVPMKHHYWSPLRSRFHVGSTRGFLFLAFAKDYNVSWKDPARYFASPHAIDASRLRRCADTCSNYRDVFRSSCKKW